MSKTVNATNDIKTTTSTIYSANGNIDTAITTAHTNPVIGHNSMTTRSIDSSLANLKTSPVTTNLVSLFQPTTTTGNFVLAQEDSFQTQETTTPKFPSTKQNSPTSLSTISYPDTLAFKNPLSTLNSLVFRTSSSSNDVYNKETFGGLVSKQSGSSFNNQPDYQNNLFDKSNPTHILLLQTLPISPNVLPFKSSCFDLNISSPESTSSNLKTSSFDSNISSSESTSSNLKTSSFDSNISSSESTSSNLKTSSFDSNISSPESTSSNLKTSSFDSNSFIV